MFDLENATDEQPMLSLQRLIIIENTIVFVASEHDREFLLR